LIAPIRPGEPRPYNTYTLRDAAHVSVLKDLLSVSAHLPRG
jgi:hypothetical protein